MCGKINRNKLIHFVFVLPLVILAAILLSIVRGTVVLAVDDKSLTSGEPSIGVSIVNDKDLHANDNPFDDEIAKVEQTVWVETPLMVGYELSLSVSGDNNSLVNGSHVIKAMSETGDLSGSAVGWGYKLTDELTWQPVPVRSQATMIKKVVGGSGAPDPLTSIYYGVNTPKLTPAGTYSVKLRYTAIAVMPTTPIVISMSPNERNIDNGNDGNLKMDGYNLNDFVSAYIDFDKNGRVTDGETCSIISALSNEYHFECKLPTSVKPGNYSVYLMRSNGDANTHPGNVTYYYQPIIHTVATGDVKIKRTTQVVGIAHEVGGTSLYLTDDGDVYVQGKEYRVETNQGGFTGVGSPMLIDNIPNDDPIVDVAAYNGSYYAVSKGDNREKQRLYTWGNNSHRQLGRDPSYASNKPSSTSSVGVQKVVAGENFAVILSDTGVYSFGDNNDHRLGWGATEEGGDFTSAQALVRVLNNPLANGDVIVGVAAGRAHGIMLSKQGRVYTWGRFSEGQLGWSTSSNANRPHEITDELKGVHQSPVIKVMASNNQSAALTADGHVLVV